MQRGFRQPSSSTLTRLPRRRARCCSSVRHLASSWSGLLAQPRQKLFCVTDVESTPRRASRRRKLRRCGTRLSSRAASTTYCAARRRQAGGVSAPCCPSAARGMREGGIGTRCTTMRFCCGAPWARGEKVLGGTAHARGGEARSCIPDKVFPILFSSPSPSLAPLCRPTQPTWPAASNNKIKNKNPAAACRLSMVARRVDEPPRLLGKANTDPQYPAARRSPAHGAINGRGLRVQPASRVSSCARPKCALGSSQAARRAPHVREKDAARAQLAPVRSFPPNYPTRAS